MHCFDHPCGVQPEGVNVLSLLPEHIKIYRTVKLVFKRNSSRRQSILIKDLNRLYFDIKFDNIIIQRLQSVLIKKKKLSVITMSDFFFLGGVS